MNTPPSTAPLVRLLVFIPARRDWPGGGRAALSTTTQVDFLAVPASGMARPGSAALAQLPKARSVDLVFDCLDVHTSAIAAPKLSDARLRLALPNLLEERLLADPSDCHFAAGAARAAAADGKPAVLPVAAIDRATLARALEVAEQAQLPVRAAYSALYTLPTPQAGMAAVRILHGRAVVRTATDQSCSVELEAGAASALELVRSQCGISHLRVYGTGAAQIAPIAQELGLKCDEAHAELDADCLDEAVNLLQGSFATAGGTGQAGRLLARIRREGAWKAPVAWAAACAVIALAGVNAYWAKLDGQYQDLRQSIRHSFRDAFPNETAIIDELAQARRSVAALRTRAGRPSADDFSVLNAQALVLFANAPVGIVAAIEYADGSYRIRFKPGSMDSGELRNSLQGRAQAQGLTLRFEADGSALLAPGT